MINTQRIEKVLGSGDRQNRLEDVQLDVVDVWKTIQGEGPFVGTPAVFVRLAGCNLKCVHCDTDYTSHRSMLWSDDLLEWVKLADNSNCKLIVLTGGEPFRQNFNLFARKAMRLGWNFQVETNGTVYRQDISQTTYLHERMTIVCSPKTSFVNPSLAPYISAWKYVVEAGKIDPADGLPLSALGNGTVPCKPLNGMPIYIQPLDVQDEKLNHENMQAAIQSCLKFNYRLCLQMHKYAGLA